ncbi:DUF6445 family protein [Jannaschia sp. CCS1]|uniref:DUF6445 family protein n=1 Tax=Jannaschia sp. (strain CCS1) TaxID=290400 RepID=UPI000053DCFA|nr:DUF6445 family protein [Jannaschia sp. CCS1]ABD54490.1 hypothetical protein Jann_1573 [Jannaschia sp. CCS1]
MTDRTHDITLRIIGSERHRLALVRNVFDDPDRVIDQASKADFSSGRPAYPGVVARADATTTDAMKVACHAAGQVIAPDAEARFDGDATFSIVTRDAFDAVPRPIRPHCDADTANALSAILYLSPGAQGSTVFFRHKGTGFEAIPQERLVFYKRALDWETRQRKAKAEVLDTEHDPGYTAIREVPAEFNTMVVFPSFLLHSARINHANPLPQDARNGRLTINAIFHQFAKAPDAPSRPVSD